MHMQILQALEQNPGEATLQSTLYLIASSQALMQADLSYTAVQGPGAPKK